MRSRWHASARTRRRSIGAWVVASLLASSAGALVATMPSSAQINSPTAGIVREPGALNISENRGGRYTSNNAANPSSGCIGTTTPFKPQATSTITVTRNSDNVVVHTDTHKTPNISGLFGQHAAASNAEADWVTTWDAPAAGPGVYTLKSVNTDAAKANSTASTPCTQPSGGATTDVVIDYRPWQHTFNDLLGNGRVRMNVNPHSEFEYTVSGKTSTIRNLASVTTFFAVPNGLPTLPADPADCASDPESCVPLGAVECNPAAGCVPRVALVNYAGGASSSLVGVFDLDTHAFAAYAATGGKTAVLVSAGGDNDALLLGLLGQVDGALEDATGLDLLTLLNTKIDVKYITDGILTETEIGLLHGLTISRMLTPPGVKGGVNIDAPYQINVGFGDFTVPAYLYPDDDRPDPSQFTLTPSSFVPNLPALVNVSEPGLESHILLPVALPEPLNVLGDTLSLNGGPLLNVTGFYPDAATGFYPDDDAGNPTRPTRSAGSSGLGPSVDTAPNEPNGLPAWLPALNQGAQVPADGPLDFVGHVGLFLDLGVEPVCFFIACLDLGTYFVMAQGISIYGDSPLPALGDLPLLWDTDNPAAAELNAITDQIGLDLLTNPAVAQVLAAAFGLLGGGVPDLATVTDILSDSESFLALIETVAGVGGIDNVPGLEDALNELGVVTDLLDLLGGGGGGNPLDDLLGGLLGPLGL